MHKQSICSLFASNAIDELKVLVLYIA